MQDDILNVGLDLAMEFGENWLMPIQSRLRLRYPALTSQEADAYDAACRTAMNAGNRITAEVVRELGGFHERAYGMFRPRLLADYPWVSEENAGALFSQGCYYVMK